MKEINSTHGISSHQSLVVTREKKILLNKDKSQCNIDDKSLVECFDYYFQEKLGCQLQWATSKNTVTISLDSS